MSVLTPPHVALSWTASSITTAFGGYRVYRRPARAVAQPWVLIAEITVPTGYTAATVEAQHRFFRDYEAGWSITGGPHESGWDYYVSYVNATTGLESGLSNVDARNVIPAETPWVVSNDHWWLNTPLEILNEQVYDQTTRQTVHETAGTDLFSVRTERKRPGRIYQATFEPFAKTGLDQLRGVEAVAYTGEAFVLHRRDGDRLIGPLTVGGTRETRVRRIPTALQVVETSRESTTPGDETKPDYNLPPALVMNGSSQYITTPDNALLDPGTTSLSLVYAGTFPSTTGKVLLAKTELFTTGYALFTGSNSVGGIAVGASGSPSPSETSVAWSDGNVHVAVAAFTGGSSQLYRDGVQVASVATAMGAVTGNADALGAGATGGGTAFAVTNMRAYAVYGRKLSATEARDASYYLLGYPGYRMPAGAIVFVDLRDSRSWNGVSATVTDLSGNGLNGTVTGSPATRGIPVDLSTWEVA